MRELARAVGHEFRDVLRMHEIRRELHNIAPAGAHRRERRADIGEDLGTLRLEVAVADNVAAGVGGELAGDEDEFARRLDPRDLRILTEWLSQSRRIEDGDLGHRQFSKIVSRGAFEAEIAEAGVERLALGAWQGLALAGGDDGGEFGFGRWFARGESPALHFGH